jgi:hypothetical protein
MRILSLDFDPVYGDDCTRSSFASDVSVFDYDLVIWDPRNSLDDYIAYEKYMGQPALTDNSSVEFSSDFKRRHGEFSKFLDSGRVLIVISRPPIKCAFATGERKYSGTGRNRVTTRIVDSATLQAAIPRPDVTFVPAKGQRIQTVGDGPIQALIRKYHRNFEYHAILNNAPGIAVAEVAGTNQAVASIEVTPSGGILLILPHIELRNLEKSPSADDPEDDESDDADEGDRDEFVEIAPEFQEDLIAAITRLSGNAEASRPAWSQRFATEFQQKVRDEVLAEQRRVEEARTALAEAKQRAEDAEAQDQLFLGTGKALEIQVRDVLQILGGEVHEAAPGRDDWRATFPEGRVVVEVKGVSKSAAEKHAAQLEKWVASAYEETGELHKGLLVVNTWREVPLDERTGPDFPDQMIGYSTARQHALLTGLQLFTIRQQIESGAATAEEWRKAIFGAAGRVEGGEDWQRYLVPTAADRKGDDGFDADKDQ